MVARFCQLYRDEAEKGGYQATADQRAWSNSIYVAETDAKQAARVWIHRRLPQLLRIHFAETLVPLNGLSAARILKHPLQCLLEAADIRTALTTLYVRAQADQTLQLSSQLSNGVVFRTGKEFAAIDKVS